MTFPLLHLVLFTTTIFSVWVYQKINQELTRMLTATLAIVGFIWGLAIAHWSIQLLILIASIIIFQLGNFKNFNKSS
jgi:hypothetical protein